MSQSRFPVGARRLILWCKLNADRMNYTPRSHKGARALRLLPLLEAAMQRAS
jgi:hypothetical protein